MGSFYGPSTMRANSSGEGGTSNYDDLLNKPIKNIRGTDSRPIIFNELSLGNYVLVGHYQISQEEEMIDSVTPRIIQIYQDETTGDKVAKYESYEDGEYFVISVFYNKDGTYKIEKNSPYQNYSEDIKQMQEQVINVTNTTITNALTIVDF